MPVKTMDNPLDLMIEGEGFFQVTTIQDGDPITAYTRAGNFTSIVACRVVEVLPGGIFHIYGRREMIVNHELQLLTVEGLVRREDIGINNTVLSSALADARLTYDGIGVIDDKQRPPLLARWMDWLFPF